MVKTYASNTGTGTATSTITWTNSGTSTSFSQGWFDSSIIIKNPANLFKPKVKVRDLPKRNFWDGIKWEEYTAYFPHKSITGKWIVGKMHKRSKKGVIKGGSYQQANVKHTVLDRRTSHTQYAKTKELFKGKLKGTA